MSTTVDNRVVELQFDNKQFESNVKTTMSTLERLKQSLNLKGASQGLEDVQTAASKCNLSGLTQGISAAQNSFSALQVMGVTALATITNQAVNAGQRMVKALTIAPLTSGYSEYETQMNAIQTILANTQKEGTNVQIVNKYLDELNEYADKTIYNFTEMTRNIGTFTAAGVKLDTSVTAIKGIANLAAVSGSTSQQASTAMYQLSQALASGTVKLVDWNSVVNAGMGGQVFQDALIRTSELLKTGAQAAIDTEGSFRDSLQKGWLTAEVLTQTLDMFATAAETEEEYAAAVEKFVSQGYTEAQAKQMADMAKTAGEAATKVKTFTQLMDTCKEALGSGWAQTWRLIFGDFEQARELWTEVGDVLTGLINSFSEARNALLESALGKTFTGLAEKVTDVLEPAMSMADTVGEVAGAVEDLGAIVDDVILGKFGNGQDRFDALTKAGKNYYKVQNGVNEALGNSFRYTDEQIKAQDELLGIQESSAEATGEVASETKKLTKEQRNQLVLLGAMTDEELRSAGYTEEQIAALQELRDVAKKLNMPFAEFIDNMDAINGRWILINSFKNIGSAIAKVFTAIGDAMGKVFDPIQPDQLFDLILNFHDLTASLIPNKDILDKITRTFKGLFAAIDLVTTIVGGAFKVAFEVLCGLFGIAGGTILDLTAELGDLIYTFNEWFQNSVFSEGVQFIVDAIKGIIEWIDDFVEALKIDEGIADAFESVCVGLKAAWDLAKAGFSASLNSSLKILKSVLDIFGLTGADVAAKIADIIIKIRDWVSENTFLIGAIGKIAEIIVAVIEGVKGLVEGFLALEPVQTLITDVTNAFVEFFKKFNIFDRGNLLENILYAITRVFSDIGRFFSGLKEQYPQFGVDLVQGLIDGIIANIGRAANAMLELALALIDAFCRVLGIHSPSKEMEQQGENVIQGLVNGIISGISSVWNAIKAVATSIITAITGGTNSAFEAGRIFFTGFYNGIREAWTGVKEFIGGIGQGIADVIGRIDWGVVALALSGVVAFFMFKRVLDIFDKFGDAAKALTKPLEGLGKMFESFGKVANSFADLNKAKIQQMKVDNFKNIAIAIGIIAASLWVVSTIDGVDLFKAATTLIVMTGVLVLFVAALDHITSKEGDLKSQLANVGKVAGLILSVGAALILLAIGMKIIGSIDEEPLKRAGAVLAGFVALVALLLLATKFAGNSVQIATTAKLIAQVGAILLLLATFARIVGSMEWEDLGKAGVALAGFEVFIVSLLLMSLLLKKSEFDDIGNTMLKLAGSMAILALVAKLIATMSWNDMKKAALGIGFLSAIVVALMGAVQLVDGKKFDNAGLTLLGVAAAIGILAVVAKLMAGTPWDALAKGGLAIAGLGVVMMGLIIATRFAGGRELKGVAKTLIAMGLCIGILAGVCVLLGLVDPSTLMKGIAAMAALGIIVSLMTAATFFGKDVAKTMQGIAIAIGVLVASIIILSFIDPAKLVAPVTAISIVLGMFALVELASKNVTEAFKTVLVMSLVIAILAGALYLLSEFGNAQSMVTTATALSLLLAAFSLSLVALSKIAGVSKSAITGAYAMTGVVAILAIVLGVLSALDVEPSIETALSLSVLLLAVSAAVAILAPIGAIATGALPAVGVVAALIGAIGLILIAIGALATYFPQVEEFLDKGAAIFDGIGRAIGSFFGNIVAGFSEAVYSALPEIGTSLSEFMTNLQPFLSGLKTVDESMISAAESLAKVILAITGAGLIDALTSFFTGDTAFDSISDGLVSFGRGMKSYAKQVQGIDSESILQSAKAAEALVKVAKAIPSEGGFWQLIAGHKDLESFGEQLVPFGKGMKAYGKSVEGLNAEAIMNSVDGAKGIAKVAKSIPSEGGFWQLFTGEKKFDVFANQLAPFAEGMKTYGNAVDGLKVEAIENSVKATDAIVDVIEALPTEGGLFDNIATFFGGDVDTTIEDKLVPFANGMKLYSDAVVGLDAHAITNSVDAAKGIRDIVKAMPSGGAIVDETHVALTRNLVPLGQSMSQYSEAVKSVNSGAVQSSVDAGKNIANFIRDIADMNTSGVSPFVDAVNRLSTLSFDDITTALSDAPAALSTIGTAFISGLANGMQQGREAVTISANSVVDTVIEAFFNSAEKFTTSGETLVSALATGITEAAPSATQAVRFIAMSAASAASALNLEFWNAGVQCAKGFANGISSGSFTAIANARAMANAAVVAAKQALDINSPSKVFMKIGEGVPEGFAKGIDKYGYYVDDSIETMAADALDNTKSVISRIGDALSNTELDSQPTIRPVLDMSDVESGAKYINGMFSDDFAMGTKMNLNAISTSMRNRNQNGVNDDVVSAIDKLRKDVGNLENRSYSIGNISYSHGDEVYNAIETLVRAVRVEGRA